MPASSIWGAEGTVCALDCFVWPTCATKPRANGIVSCRIQLKQNPTACFMGHLASWRIIPCDVEEFRYSLRQSNKHPSSLSVGDSQKLFGRNLMLPPDVSPVRLGLRINEYAQIGLMSLACMQLGCR